MWLCQTFSVNNSIHSSICWCWCGFAVYCAALKWKQLFWSLLDKTSNFKILSRGFLYSGTTVQKKKKKALPLPRCILTDILYSASDFWKTHLPFYQRALLPVPLCFFTSVFCCCFLLSPPLSLYVSSQSSLTLDAFLSYSLSQAQDVSRVICQNRVHVAPTDVASKCFGMKTVEIWGKGTVWI